jgi:hypothetical protein
MKAGKNCVRFLKTTTSIVPPRGVWEQKHGHSRDSGKKGLKAERETLSRSMTFALHLSRNIYLPKIADYRGV